MKIRIIFIMILALWFAGCRDFLDEVSQDEVRPSSVGDMEQILLGDGYEDEQNIYYLSDIFTDDMQNNAARVAGQEDPERWMFVWDDQMFNEAGGGENISLWQVPYEGILGCNIVLDYLDKVEGDPRLRENLRGEALVLRAWYYLHLVNFFGVAYNQGDPALEPGVPLKPDMNVTGEHFARNTVGEVYAQIEKDLLEGNRLLTLYDYGRNYFRIGHLAAKSILSRVYLYMEEWDKALAYADSVLMIKSDLLDLNQLAEKNNWSQLVGYAPCLYDPVADEIIWGRKNKQGRPVGVFGRNLYTYSEELNGVYGVGMSDVATGTPLKGDFRGYFYFTWFGGGRGAVAKGSITPSYFGSIWQGIRSSELYLNRAEAYARKYIEEGNEAFRIAALADLNYLRTCRFNKKYYEKKELVDGKELLQFCLDERRRELIGETNHRWCDLRRLGKTVVHVMVDEGNVEYTQDMTRYVLPIPEEIIKRNPALTQNN